MRFWRICRRRFAEAAATGEGARLYGGRWNSRGIKMVYASTSLALAAIETFVNLEPNLQPSDLVYVAGEIPEAFPIERLEIRDLPPDWHRARNESLHQIGAGWIRRGQTVGILVPSAAIPQEWNILLNPLHEDFARIKFEPPKPFEFDPRMFVAG